MSTREDLCHHVLTRQIYKTQWDNPIDTYTVTGTTGNAKNSQECDLIFWVLSTDLFSHIIHRFEKLVSFKSHFKASLILYKDQPYIK